MRIPKSFSRFLTSNPLGTTLRLRQVLAVLAAGLACVGAASSASDPDTSRGTGLGASHVVIDATNPDSVYVPSTLYGVYRSHDGGVTWRLSTDGVGASDFYALAVHPTDSRVLFVGAAGGGLYRSDDSGATWTPTNRGLADTSVYDILFDRRDPRIMYVLTLREVYTSADGGASWRPVFREHAALADRSFHRRLVVVPGARPTFLVATGERGYRRAEGDDAWRPLIADAVSLKVTAFAFHEATGTLYAAAAFAEGLYRSADGGATWMTVGTGLSRAWSHRLIVDPGDARVLYLATKNAGVMKSADGGATWTGINAGLTEQDVKGLAIHPRDSKRLYAATYGRGIFTSDDGGARWVHRPVPEFPTWEHLYASLARSVQARGRPPDPPDAFRKCQECHGWTDPLLNGPTKQTFWRVFPSHRDWHDTMGRMRGPARLTPADEAAILAYLNTYYGPEPAPPFAQARVLELPMFRDKACRPTNLAAADLNGDGRTDLAVSGFCNRFAVLFADPETPGGFLPPREIQVPTSAIGLAVIPRTNGLPLIVVSNCANPDAIDRQPLLHVVSMDRLEVVETLPSGGKAPDDIAVADFNGDGRLDLAVGHWKGGVLSVLLGTERDGAFRVPEPSSPQRVVIGDEHWQVVARDLDRDNDIDVAFPVWTNGTEGDRARTAHLVVLRGDGRGGFQAEPLARVPLDREARSLTVADFDGDGAPDIAVANPGSGVREDGTIVVAAGGASFAPRNAGEPRLELLAPQGIASADFDRDGSPDVVVASRPVNGPGRVTVLYNDGGGRFARARAQELSFGAKARVSALGFQPILATDVNGDGAPDLVVANNEGNTVSIFYNGSAP